MLRMRWLMLSKSILTSGVFAGGAAGLASGFG